MRRIKAVQKCAFAAVLIGVVTHVGVVPAQASIATDTAAALADHPDGGPDLELAIADILGGHQGQPRLIVREILRATVSATDEQMVAIGKALAAEARALAETDPDESRAVVAAVLATQNSQLVRNFEAAGGYRPPPLFVPVGDGGHLDTSSPN